MSFVVLLLAILIEKFSALRQRLQRDSGWVRELHKLEASTRLANRPWWVLVILVLLPVMLLGLLLVVLDPVAYGLLALPVVAMPISRATMPHSAKYSSIRAGLPRLSRVATTITTITPA